jgi:peptidoglycan/LPS O-acetylase OafA/YrhL
LRVTAGLHKSIKYRPEIDGLRALAVLPVILNHAGMPGFHGGFLGVDIFFVISGFLITSIIYREMQGKYFSIAKFYERRARRILPAFFLMLIAVLVCAMIMMAPWELDAVARNAVACLLFISNIFAWKTTGYFSAAFEVNPLGHIWSLAVEEQFYILFPIFLWVVNRFAHRYLVLILAVGALASLLLAQYLSPISPNPSFYLLPTRAWELAAGAIIAIRPPPVDRLPGWARQAGGVLGLLLIVGSYILFDQYTVHPGLLTVIPVAGALAIFLFATADSVAGRLLAWRPLVLLGLISYPLYLWHQPVFVFMRLATPMPAASPLYWLAIAITVGLSAATTLFVENPIRKRQIGPRISLALGAVMMVGLLGVSAGLAYTQGLPQRFSPYQLRAFNIHNESPEEELAIRRGHACAGTRCYLGDPDATPTAMLVGDSHAGALNLQLDEALRERHMSSRVSITPGCPPIPGLKGCAETFDKDLTEAANDPHIKTVIFAARWPLIFEGTSFYNGEDGMEYGPEKRYYLRDGSIASQATIGRLLTAKINALLGAGKQVIIMYPFAEAGFDVPRTLGFRTKGPEYPVLSTPYARYLTRTASSRRVLDALGQRPSLFRVYPPAYTCNHPLPGRCVTNNAAISYYFDDDHLSAEGTKPIVAEIVKHL